MVSPVPTFQSLIRVDTFRDLVSDHFAKEIAEGQEYDARDLQRFRDIDEYATMFVQHGQMESTFNQERALHIFHAAMTWRKKNQVYDISTNQFPANYFDRQGIFFKNHDINNNPILHFVIRTFVKGQEDNDVVKRFVIYTLERHVRRHPGQRIVILFDMSETGLKNLDYDLVKFIIGCIQINYPSLLAYMLIFKLPFILTAAWRIIRTWLPPEADQFVKFVDVKSIAQFVRSDQLSITMGGTDTSNYVHICDPVNDALDDPMNINSKKKVTFADSESLEFQSLPSPLESSVTTDILSRMSSPLSEDSSTPEESANPLLPLESPQSIARRSILQKPIVANGFHGDEKVLHGLAIRPHDELLFERSDSTALLPTDSIQTLTLTNTGDKILTFKIKTTSPEKFRVKPGCSLLHPGASTSISVYLLKAHCTPSTNISKEKFLIIWTLIGQELKQTQLIDFWKNVPNSVLYEHRLKCSFGPKQTSAGATSPSNETITTMTPPSSPSDASLIEIRKLLSDSMALQRTAMLQTSRDLQQTQRLLLILLALIFLMFLWEIIKSFLSFSSSSHSPHEL